MAAEKTNEANDGSMIPGASFDGLPNPGYAIVSTMIDGQGGHRECPFGELEGYRL